MTQSIDWTWEKTDLDLITEIESAREFELVIQCQKLNPPFMLRRCRAVPTKQQEDLIFALSGGQDFKRSFSGKSFRGGACDDSYYLGWNTMGFFLEVESCYCRICGYAMTEIARASKVVIDSTKVSKDYIEEIRRKCEKTEIEFAVR